MVHNYLIEPARFKLDGGAMYGIIPKPLWNKVHPADEQNRVDLALRLWLIKSEDKVILIDTGIGDYHGEKFDQRFDVRSDTNPLAQALAELDLTTDDITDLVISHLHFDHVGGIGIHQDDGQMIPVLKKARCHVHSEHYEYAQNPTERDQGSFHTHCFMPVLDYYREHNQLVMHEGEEGFLLNINDSTPLKFKCSFGHTPWLMHPFTPDYIYLSDLVPTTNHLHIPWVMGYDISPGVTTIDKKNFFDFILERKLSVIYEHDPKYWGSSLKREGKKIIHEQTFQAQDKLAYRAEE